MSKARWRPAMVAGSLLLMTVLGSGLAQAAPSSTAATRAVLAPAAEPGLPGTPAERLRGLHDRFGDGRFARFRQRLVHGTFTVVGRDGELVTIQVDHGTVAAIADGSITIAETGDASVTVNTSDDTKVRKDRKPSSLGALAVGDEVFVHSIVEDGAATARFIFVPRPAAADSSAGAS
jgi:hypothetical protein